MGLAQLDLRHQVDDYQCHLLDVPREPNTDFDIPFESAWSLLNEHCMEVLSKKFPGVHLPLGTTRNERTFVTSLSPMKVSSWTTTLKPAVGRVLGKGEAPRTLGGG